IERRTRMKLPIHSLKQTLAIILLLLLQVCPAHGQVRGDKVFAPVPEQLRPQLFERLNLLVQYEREQSWDKQFDLLSNVSTYDETKEGYIGRRQGSHINPAIVVGFTPKYPSQMYQGRWDIFGCVTVTRDGRTLKLNGEVSVFFEIQNGVFHRSISTENA